MKNYLIITDDLITIEDSIKNITEELSLSTENITRFDLTECPLVDVIEELNTYGLFYDNKIVVVDAKVILSTDKIKSDFPQDEEMLIKYIENPNELNSLVLVTDKIDERKKLSKLLKKSFTIIDKKVTIEDKIKNSTEGYTISPRTINYLISSLNNDNERILNELEKLKLYKLDTKEITTEDIDEICVKEFNEDVFSLVNSIVKKDIAKSFEIYSILLSRGEEFTKIVITVLDQFRLIYRTKLLMNEGKSKDEITSILKIHPYRVKLAMEESYNFNLVELKKIIIDLGQIDIDIKSGKSPNEYEFDVFLINLIR